MKDALYYLEPLQRLARRHGRLVLCCLARLLDVRLQPRSLVYFKRRVGRFNRFEDIWTPFAIEDVEL